MKSEWTTNLIVALIFTAFFSGIPIALYTNNPHWLWTLAGLILFLS
jgi:hypothetical protein